MEYEDLEKIIANKIALSYDFARGFLYSYSDIAKGILSLDGIEIKSDDQSLPNVYWTSTKPMYDRYPQELMLKPDPEGNHWVRVIPKPKRK